MKKIIKRLTFSGIFVLMVLYAIIGYYYCILPDNFYLSKGESLKIRNILEITASSKNSKLKTVALNNDNSTQQAELKLFGILPIKTVSVQTIDRPVLTPCGTPFGIKIRTEGVVVTGFGTVANCFSDKNTTSPAELAGLEKGDIITSINDIKVTSSSVIPELVALNNKETKLSIIRNGEEKTIIATPKKAEDNNYKLGLWVRDSTAGIGTMTYYDSSSGVFGGLGHAVCDVDTGMQLPVQSGEIVPVCINSVQKGYAGYPGELCGSFISPIATGSILENTCSGLFGTIDYAPTINSGMPMALKQEVEVGNAKILTTLNGTEPQEYDIIIEKIEYNAENVKNMVIKITDERLLSEAGGIVQGMSGSPIIQNGKLVGAVTHVFVNDPVHGYGIFAENMYDVSSKLSADVLKKAA